MADDLSKKRIEDGEPDVELHAHSKAVDEAAVEPEDKADDGPDVELHRHKAGG